MDNLLSRIDLNQITNSRVSRGVVFFSSLGLFVALDIQANRIMLDVDSIYPFSIMLLAPALLALKLGPQAISVIRRCCVSVGVFVCALNIVAILSDMSEVSDFLSAQRLVYAPLALGIVLSLLLKLIEPATQIAFRLSKFEFCTFFLVWLICGAASAKLLFGTNVSISSIWSTQTAIICITVWVICLTYPEYSSLNFLERTKKASLGIILVSAISGVSLWTYVVASRDVATVGPLLAVPVIGFLNGSSLSIIATSASASRTRKNDEDKLFDWHVIESYAFYILIVAPPLSMIEAFV